MSTTCTSSTCSGPAACVVIPLKTPPAPPVPDQVTSHRIVTVAVRIDPSEVCRYTNPHPPGGRPSPSASVHARPGPAHDTADDPSPGSNTSTDGLATTVADTPGTLSVFDTGAYDNGDVQNHVQMFSHVNGTPLYEFVAGGDRSIVGAGNRNNPYARCAN